jgi:hypothetical protein
VIFERENEPTKCHQKNAAHLSTLLFHRSTRGLTVTSERS